MPEETLGYVELEWTCPNCGTRNPVEQKTCQACGGAMREGQQFEVPAAPTLLDEAARAEAAQETPDIHCGYCGTRNPAGAARCSQCGADLMAGAARKAGAVLGAFPTPGAAHEVGAVPAASPTPGAPQAAPALPRAAKRGGCGLGIGCAVALGVVLLVVAGLIFLSTRTQETVGRVQGVSWERAIAVQELRPVAHDAWRTDVPAGATLGACTPRELRMQDNPAPGAQKVCGTAYIVDQGTGKGKVQQSCRYRVMADYCQYTVPAWTVVNRVVARGSDLNPQWPQAALAAGQRRGDQSETYTVVFTAGDRQYTYALDDAAAFARFTPGSRWLLKVNALGSVNSVTPAR